MRDLKMRRRNPMSFVISKPIYHFVPLNERAARKRSGGATSHPANPIQGPHEFEVEALCSY
jgi:hypothetical protein